jgi:hypothetical protein
MSRPLLARPSLILPVPVLPMRPNMTFTATKLHRAFHFPLLDKTNKSETVVLMSTCRTFTPVPKRVMDGSEDTDVLPAAVLSGAPIELQARTVRYVSQVPLFPFCKLDILTKHTASTNHPNLPHSPANGAAITGEWIGTSWARDTDGKIL